MNFIETIKERARQEIKTIVLPEAEDIRTLKATEVALKEKYANIILVGNEKKIKEKAETNNVNIDGAKIIDRSSLVPLEAFEQNMCKDLQGLSLRNVNIELKNKENNKIIYQDFGEMLFTHFGVSGPTILSGSAHLVRYKNIDELLKNKKIVLSIDFKPALSEEKLDERILRDFAEFKNKQFKNSLDKLLPQKLIPVVIEKSGINPNKKVNEINKKERHRLVNLLKNFEIDLH